jgi:hypothetical protein
MFAIDEKYKKSYLTLYSIEVVNGTDLDSVNVFDTTDLTINVSIV